MDERRWEDLEMDCLVQVLEKVGMESLLLDVPFVCKSWYKATLNPSCWQSLIFPDNECIFVWPFGKYECSNFQTLMDRFASEYQIDGDRCSVTAFLKFVINRSSGNATVLKLPKCCTVEAFEFAANVCPGLVSLSLPGNILNSKHTNLEPIGKWKNLEELSLVSCYFDERHALSIVKLVPNIKYLNLKGARFILDNLVTLLRGCKDLVMLDARNCLYFGFVETKEEISKLASHISIFMGGDPNFPESATLFADEMGDDTFNDLLDELNHLGDEE